jgi:hypothetical protein
MPVWCVAGVHVDNLFAWNSITITQSSSPAASAASSAASSPSVSSVPAASTSSSSSSSSSFSSTPSSPSPLCIEYVHIRGGSARFAVGDRVRRGQIVCESGAAGFCPEVRRRLLLCFCVFRSVCFLLLLGGEEFHVDCFAATHESVFTVFAFAKNACVRLCLGSEFFSHFGSRTCTLRCTARTRPPTRRPFRFGGAARASSPGSGMATATSSLCDE